jgi:hypothetical protein
MLRFSAHGKHSHGCSFSSSNELTAVAGDGQIALNRAGAITRAAQRGPNEVSGSRRYSQVWEAGCERPLGPTVLVMSVSPDRREMPEQTIVAPSAA